MQPSRPLQQLDEYENLAPSLLRELDVRGCQQFTERHPEFYASDLNGDLLIGWIESRGVCYSLRNLEAAYFDLLEENAFEERPQEPAAPAQTLVQRITRIWPADTRPKSATSLVLDPRTVAAKETFEREKAARVVERQSEPIPTLSVEEARQLVPLPKGEDKRHQTLKQVQKDRKLDITELRDAANRERIAIAKSRGTYNRGY